MELSNDALYNVMRSAGIWASFFTSVQSASVMLIFTAISHLIGLLVQFFYKILKYATSLTVENSVSPYMNVENSSPN